MARPSDYEHIHSWELYNVQHLWFVEQEQKRAAEQGAPIDAIYYSGDGWITASGLDSEHPFHAFHRSRLAESQG